MNWARTAGLRTPSFELRKVVDFDRIPEEMPAGDGSVFVIERFDRNFNDRIHMEDFGQILDRPPGDAQYHGAYEEIASVVRWIAPESAHEFLKAIVFNVVCGNGDAHLKNFSVVCPTRDTVLSPAYDIVSTLLYYPSGKEQLALTLHGERKFQAVNLQSFGRIIEKLGIERSVGEQLVRELAEKAIRAWHQADVQSNYTKQQIDRLNSHLDTLPLITELRAGDTKL